MLPQDKLRQNSEADLEGDLSEFNSINTPTNSKLYNKVPSEKVEFSFFKKFARTIQ